MKWQIYINNRKDRFDWVYVDLTVRLEKCLLFPMNKKKRKQRKIVSKKENLKRIGILQNEYPSLCM